MAIRQLPSPRWTIPGNSGSVAAGYHVYTYQPGTSTPKPTYADPDGTTENPNPIVLDSRGEYEIWWDGQYKVVAYTGDKDVDGVEVWTQDDYGEGDEGVLTGNFNLVRNGSFELDTNGDGEPDNWTVTEYTDSGGVTLDSTEQYHGQYSLKFLSVGSGGGFATSSYTEVQGGLQYAINFAIYSSVANIHNVIDVIWYTAAKAVISTSSVYDDQTTNPTSWSYQQLSATAPSNARFARVRVTGAKDDNANSGTVWFDNVVLADVDGIATNVVQALFPNVDADVTASDEELNTLDGITASTVELNTLTGITANTSELNILDGVSATTSDLNQISGATIVGYSLQNAYHNASGEVDTEATSAQSVFFKPDGTKMYVLDSNSDSVYQYTLSTAWDVSTASYDSKSYDPSTEVGDARGMFFKPDGLAMYIGDDIGDTIYQYTLSTAWDVSTASYASLSASVGTEMTTPTGIAFSSDGTKMYVSGGASSTIYQYTLSTAWDVSTASYASLSASVSSEETTPWGPCFSGDGTLFFIGGVDSQRVHKYRLNIAWNIASAEYNGVSYSPVLELIAPYGVFFKPDGRKMYLVGAKNASSYIVEYLTNHIAVDS